MYQLRGSFPKHDFIGSWALYQGFTVCPCVSRYRWPKSKGSHRSVEPSAAGVKPRSFEVALGKTWEIQAPDGTQFMRGPPVLLTDGRSYANLINSPAMPKNTTAAPTLSSDSATIPMAATHMAMLINRCPACAYRQQIVCSAGPSDGRSGPGRRRAPHPPTHDSVTRSIRGTNSVGGEGSRLFKDAQ